MRALPSVCAVLIVSTLPACVPMRSAEPAPPLPSPLPVTVTNMPQRADSPPQAPPPLPTAQALPPIPTPLPVEIRNLRAPTPPLPNPFPVRITNTPAAPRFPEPPFQVEIANLPAVPAMPVPLSVRVEHLPPVDVHDDKSLFDWVNSLLSVVLTGVTCIAVWFSKRLNDETKRNAAAVARVNEAQLRPYVAVAEGKVASFSPLSAGTYQGAFQIQLKNLGTTIAKGVAFDAQAVLVTKAQGTTPAPPSAGSAHFPLAPGGTINGTFEFPTLTAKDLADIRSGDAVLFLTGAIEYSDNFIEGTGAKRSTTFCYVAPAHLQADAKLGYWGTGNDAT